MVWHWRQKNRNQAEQDQGIKEIAHAVYLNRTRLSKAGDAQTDWETARKIASNPLKKLLFVGNQPLIRLKQPAGKSLKFVAWDVPRWFLFSFPQLEWMKLIAVPLVLAAAGSIISSQIQRESSQITALKQYFDQLERLTFDQKLLDDKPNTGAIVIARGRTVASLRELDIQRKRQLLAFLQASELLQSTDPKKEPIISFRAANLSDMDLSNTDLSKTDLQGTNLDSANLKKATLTSVNLKEARLIRANLEWAYMPRANLEWTILYRANLEWAFLPQANLERAFLVDANLEGALLDSANLEEARLNSANLEGASLIDANLEGASLFSTNLKEAILVRANLEGAKGISQKQLSQAFLCRTILPEGIDLDPDRDCDRLPYYRGIPVQADETPLPQKN